MKDAARQARRDQIEAAAYEVLEARGYAGLSVLAVAKAARASNETLYRWYGDKAGLIRALISRNAEIVGARLTEALEAETDPQEILAQIGPLLLTMLTGPRAVALNRAAAADETGALGKTLAKAGRNAVVPLIGQVMQGARDAGQLDGPVPEMADVWVSLLVGDLQVRRVTGAMDELSPEQICARATRADALLFRLFAPQPALTHVHPLDGARHTD